MKEDEETDAAAAATVVPISPRTVVEKDANGRTQLHNLVSIIWYDVLSDAIDVHGYLYHLIG